jgi:carboxyl-terminal processing protease
MNSFQTFKKNLTLFLLLLLGFGGGYYFGVSGFEVALVKKPPFVEIENKFPVNQTVDFGQFWSVWDTLQEKHLERPFDSQTLVEGAINGMIKATEDPYSSYFNEEESIEVSQSLNGQYQGIGAELTTENSVITVVSPLEGSPAQKAGLKTNDMILEVDGESILGISVREAVNIIRGPAGSEVILNIQRGSENFELTITRGVITIDSVRWEDLGDNIGYLRLSRFGEDTTSQWRSKSSEMINEMYNLDALILDMRGNPGGYVTTALEILGDFIPGEVGILTETADGSQQEYYTDTRGLFSNLPVYILLDEGSASASEIIAIALKEEANALIFGKTSFGKGTMQSVEDLDNSATLHLTTQKWLSPNGTWVHKEGITPDFEVLYNTDDSEVDAQLEAVIYYINNGELKETSDIENDFDASVEE